MAKIIKELVTKWTYRVDSTQITRATQSLKALRSQLTGVRKSSVAFGNKEAVGLKRVKRGWDSAAVSARRYAAAAAAGGGAGAAGAGGGLLGRRRGGGGGGRGGSNALAGVAAGGNIRSAAFSSGGLAIGGAALGTGAILALAGAREQADVAFTGFLKSGEKSKEMLDSLTQFAKKTPFQIPQLRELSSALLAGGFAAEEVIPSLQQLGDVTRGNSEKLGRMLTNFIQVRTVGKASTRDLNQFALAGIPIYGALEDVTGRTGEGVKELGRQGGITFKIIKEAFSRMTGVGGLFFEAMEAQSRTFFGRLSNIKDGLIEIGEEMGNEILPNSKEIAESMQEWLNVNKKPIVSGFSGFVKDMKVLKDSASFLIDDYGVGGAVTLGFVALGAAVLPVTTAVAALLIALQDLSAFQQGKSSFTGDVVKYFTENNASEIFKDIGDKIRQKLRENRAIREIDAADTPPTAGKFGSEGVGGKPFIGGVPGTKEHRENMIRNVINIMKGNRDLPTHFTPGGSVRDGTDERFAVPPVNIPGQPNPQSGTRASNTMNQINNITTDGSPEAIADAIASKSQAIYAV